MLLSFSDQFKFNSHDVAAKPDRELLCSCIGMARVTNESRKSNQSEFFMFVELIQSLIFSGKDCLKTHRTQERFQFKLTIMFIAESVAQ